MLYGLEHHSRPRARMMMIHRSPATPAAIVPTTTAPLLSVSRQRRRCSHPRRVAVSTSLALDLCSPLLTTRGRAAKTRRSRPVPRASDAHQDVDDDDLEDARVLELTSKKALDDLISAGAAGRKLVVLAVRREKGFPASASFEPKFSSMAADFAEEAVFAKLLYDKSEATRLAAGTLKVEEVPAFFIWKDGKLQDEYSGTSYESLHHAVARCLGVVEDVG